MVPPLILIVAASTVKELNGWMLPMAPLKVVVPPISLIVKAWVFAVAPLMVVAAVLKLIAPLFVLVNVVALEAASKTTGPV